MYQRAGGRGVAGNALTSAVDRVPSQNCIALAISRGKGLGFFLYSFHGFWQIGGKYAKDKKRKTGKRKAEKIIKIGRMVAKTP